MSPLWTVPRITHLLLLLSGFAALTHQIVWLRLLSLSIGMTSVATGAVLAAVFLGMALGSWLSAHLPKRLQQRLLPFAIAEMLVAISALILLPIMLNLGQWLALLPEWSEYVWFRFTLVTLLLALPAAGLGAAYPLVANVHHPATQGAEDRLWHLYGIHTLGAVIGVLTAAFVLIPNWGLDGALYGASAFNLLAALLALRLEQLHPTQAPSKQLDSSCVKHGSRAGLVVLCITGVVAVAVQIGWTKYLAIYTGSTLYGFSLLLAIFLSGIALGSWLGRYLAIYIKQTGPWLVSGLITLGLTLLVSRSGLGLLPAIDHHIATLTDNSSYGLTLRSIAILLVVLPATLVFGALFPLALRYYSGATINGRVGKGYAANSLAGLAGAVIAGLWLIPKYGTDTLLLTMSVLVVLSSLLLTFELVQLRYRIGLFFLALLISGIGSKLPGLDYQGLINISDHLANIRGETNATSEPKFLFLKEGHTGVISLVDYDGTVVLKNDTLNEAQIELQRARSEILLGLMPQLFKPEAKKVFVVGYGAGTTTKVLAATGAHEIRTVELEPAVIEAMTQYESGRLDVLKLANVRIDIKDARNVLMMEPNKYDVVVSQPSHTWRAGSGAVFSQEYFSIVHSRLNEGGLFGMWLNLFQMDSTTLRAVFKAFFTQFPKGVVFVNNASSDLILFGSTEPLVLDYDKVAAQLAHPALIPYTQAVGVSTPNKLLSNYFLFTSEQALTIAGDSPPTTDLNILAEVRLAWFNSAQEKKDNPVELIRPYAIIKRTSR